MIENRTEPIIGMRVWNIEMRGGMPYLRSTYKSEFIWPYRKALEVDPVANHGIQAIKPDNRSQRSIMDPIGALSVPTVESLIHSYSAQVMGEVYLWGRVEETEYGYFAQFAYPKRLWISPEMDIITFMQLEDEYGVPCETHESLKPKDPASSQNFQYFQYYPGSSPTINVSTMQVQNYYAQIRQAQQQMMQNYVYGMGISPAGIGGLLGSSKP